MLRCAVLRRVAWCRVVLLGVGVAWCCVVLRDARDARDARDVMRDVVYVE